MEFGSGVVLADAIDNDPNADPSVGATTRRYSSGGSVVPVLWMARTQPTMLLGGAD